MKKSKIGRKVKRAKKLKTLTHLFGSLKFRKRMQKIRDEMRSGWKN